MKSFIRIIIAFAIGAVLGASRGINRMKTEAINLATQMYQSGLESLMNGGTEEFESQLEQRQGSANTFLSGQIQQFKQQAKDEASNILQDQLDKLFQ